MPDPAKKRTALGVLWRVAALVVAVALAAGALIAFGFGGCHDSGGFCAGEFSSTHVEAYASAAVLAALAAVAAIVPFSRRPGPAGRRCSRDRGSGRGGRRVGGIRHLIFCGN